METEGWSNTGAVARLDLVLLPGRGFRKKGVIGEICLGVLVLTVTVNE